MLLNLMARTQALTQDGELARAEPKLPLAYTAARASAARGPPPCAWPLTGAGFSTYSTFSPAWAHCQPRPADPHKALAACLDN
jgi:hypothetical protein